MAGKYDVAIDLSADTSQARLIRLTGHDKDVLEFGCATGYVSKVLCDEFSCRVTGIEQNREAAAQAAKVCKRVVVGDADTLEYADEFRDEQFDVIMFADVLEHLKGPGAVLTRVRDLIAPRGYVVASIPNVAHGSVALDLLRGNFTYRSLGLLDDTHLRFFTKRTLYDLFEASGYVVSELHRLREGLARTELQIALALFPPEVVAFAMQHDEATTYQFIVKAYPTTEGGTIERLKQEAERSEQVALALRGERDALAVELERMRGELETRRGELETRQVELSRLREGHAALVAQSAWMNAHPVWRAYLRMRRLLLPRGSKREAVYDSLGGRASPDH
jgi:2-polyprenyl-3-methyl-5-hydroxy-6-metoxy-1,4-benzoquinol methylase